MPYAVYWLRTGHLLYVPQNSFWVLPADQRPDLNIFTFASVFFWRIADKFPAVDRMMNDTLPLALLVLVSLAALASQGEEKARRVAMNLGIAFQLIDDALDYGGTSSALGKNVGDDFREGKITLPIVLSFRRGSEAERAFWQRTLEQGEIADSDLEAAIALLRKHRALEDTIERARHYGAMARDALELFPASEWKIALNQVVDFCIDRAH